MIREVSIDILPALTENGRIQIDGANSILLHNAGATVAVIDNHLTVGPGSTFQFSTQLPDFLISAVLRVQFTGVGSQRLEVATLRPKGAKFSNYEHERQ